MCCMKKFDMSSLGRAVEIWDQEGLRKLLDKSSRFVVRYLSHFILRVKYTTKAILLGNYIISLNDVKIDITNDAISDPVRKKIQTKKYERNEADFIQKYINPDLPVIDLGSGIGYSTCLIDGVTKDVTVVGVEANRLLLPVIDRTKQLNDADFVVHHTAYHPYKDQLKLRSAEDFWASSQYEREDEKQKSIIVNSSSLSEIVNIFEIEKPLQLVIDIEGGEHGLINIESKFLKSYCELIIIEFHPSITKPISHYNEMLEEIGFECIDSIADVRVYSNKSL